MVPRLCQMFRLLGPARKQRTQRSIPRPRHAKNLGVSKFTKSEDAYPTIIEGGQAFPERITSKRGKRTRADRFIQKSGRKGPTTAPKLSSR